MTTPPTDHQFVPLVATLPSADKREFQITVVSQADQLHAFQSLDKVMAGKAEKSSSNKNCEPSLSVQRDNGRVTGIRIQCSCGQTIDLACVYEAPRRSDTAKPDNSNQNQLPGNWPEVAAKPAKPEKPAKPKKK